MTNIRIHEGSSHFTAITKPELIEYSFFELAQVSFFGLDNGWAVHVCYPSRKTTPLMEFFNDLAEAQAYLKTVKELCAKHGSVTND
jgi:hypothetical protein